MLTTNCYMLGFMGAGKSYITKRLATHLDLPTLDLDALIEEHAGKTIRQIFEEEGEAAFRALEQELLYQTLEQTPTLIALGGGTPIHQNNMDWIKEHGQSIFLDPPIATLVQRLDKERAKRPLLAALSSEELEERIARRLEERRSIYERADLCLVLEQEEDIIRTCLNFLGIN
ncbi:MAG: shikimate kinase [Aureispira sp.]